MRTLVALLFACNLLPAAAPALLNAVKGDAKVNGAPATGEQTLPIGSFVRTGDGMVELLLTPGTFLRLDQKSELTLEAAGAKLTRGEALLEVLYVETPVAIHQHGIQAVILKPGLYDFDDRHNQLAVYAGQASVNKGDHTIVVDAGSGVHLRNLRQFHASPQPGSMLLAWSSLRSLVLSSQRAAAAPGHSHNYLPLNPGGDSFLYGPPVVSIPSPTALGGYPSIPPPPTVPLTAPGVPQFRRNQ